MDLLALADFVTVAAHGGYAEAARRTGRPKATLSRRVMSLEQDLGTRLIERGTRTLRLTEAGAQLRSQAEPLLAGLEEAARDAAAASAQPQGWLRISAPLLLSDLMLGTLAAEFSRMHPAVHLDITGEDRIVDPTKDGYDVVLRIDPSPEEQLVGRRVLYDERCVVAAPSIARPLPGDDSGVPAVVRSGSKRHREWTLRNDTDAHRLNVAPVMRLSSLSMIHDAVRAGAGAGLLPRLLIREDLASGLLVCWGVQDEPPVELWALHSSRRLVNPKVTAFIDFLVKSLASDRVEPSRGE